MADDTLPPATIWACVLGLESRLTDIPYVASELRAKGWTVTPLHPEDTVRRLLAERASSAVADELERIAHEAPISGNALAQARVLMAASAIRARGENRNG